MLKSKFQVEQRHENEKVPENGLNKCIYILGLEKILSKGHKPRSNREKTSKYTKFKNLCMFLKPPTQNKSKSQQQTEKKYLQYLLKTMGSLI